MRVLLIGGPREDGERLARLAVTPANGVEVEHDAAGSGVSPRGMLFEAGDGLELAVSVLARVRRDPAFDDTGAIVTLARGGYVAALDSESGFDDFMLEPYSREELEARLRALEGRHKEPRQIASDLFVDRDGQEVWINGRYVSLTAKEFALLSYLCERRGRVLTREQLLERIWGSQHVVSARTVDIHVRRLRAKLGAALPLETLRGRGYKLRREPAPPSANVSPPESSDALALERAAAREHAANGARAFELRSA